jgi:VWFA-related protein
MQLSARFTFVVAIGLFTGSPLRLAAQLAPHGPTADKTVVLDVVVDAKNSRTAGPVTGLQQQDFTVLDNKAPRTPTSFRAITAGQEPIRVVALIDAVNIKPSGLGNERDQLYKFLRAQGGHLAHPTSIAILTDTGLQLLGGFSTDGNAISDNLQKQVIGIRTIPNSTGVYGEQERVRLSYTAVQTLAAHEAGKPGRTVVLWLSPGWPLLSQEGIELSHEQQARIFTDVVNLSTQLREARVTLYALDPIGAGEPVAYGEFLKGVGKAGQAAVGDLALQVLAIKSGGLSLNANNLAEEMQWCVADLDAYYEISFPMPPSETRDSFHHLEIKLDKPGLTARTRDGYYAQP